MRDVIQLLVNVMLVSSQALGCRTNWMSLASLRSQRRSASSLCRFVAHITLVQIADCRYVMIDNLDLILVALLVIRQRLLHMPLCLRYFALQVILDNSEKPLLEDGSALLHD